MPPLLTVLAQTTTTEVPRVVGEPLDTWIVLAAGAALLVVILVAGTIARRKRTSSPGEGPES